MAPSTPATAPRVLVQAVRWEPRRVKSVQQIREQVPHAEIIWDTDRDPFGTWRRLLETAGTDPVVVLEDDVELTSRFLEKISWRISQHPDDVQQFYSMRRADLTAPMFRWETGSTYLMNQCHYLPAGTAQEVYRHTEDWAEKHPTLATGMDSALRDWLVATRRGYWLSVPSLVNHRQLRSEINPKRSTRRQATRFER